MLTFHNDPKIKEKYLTRIREHKKLDHLIQGTGWENGKGCAIGCTLDKYDHMAYETELGIPVILARLEDCIFEGLSKEEAMKWPEKFLQAIPVGIDLSKVGIKFLIEVQERNLERLNERDKKLVGKEIQAVIEILKGWLKGKLDFYLAKAVYNAAYSAAYSGADSAIHSANIAASSAASAADSAIYSTNNAASSAASAVYSAIHSINNVKIKKIEYKWQAEKLIEIIQKISLQKDN